MPKPFFSRMLLLGLWLLASQGRAGVVQFCDQNYLRGCESLNNSICLEKYYACGQYDAIIQHYSAESLTTSAEARYFKGVSYYGLFVRNRAASLKCRFSAVAKSELAAFMFQSREKGINSPRDFDRVYQASKIINELKNVSGCLESGITEDEIRFYAEEYSDARLKSLFIGASKTDGVGDVVDSMKRTIQDTIGGFVSKATKIETQTQLRDTALRASQTRLANIAQLFDKNFGKATLTLDDKGHALSLTLTLDPSRNFLIAQTNSGNWKTKMGFIEQQLKDAFQGMNINDYEKARNSFVSQASYVIQGVPGYINLNQQLVGTEASENLIKELSKPFDERSPLKTIQSIAVSWNQSGQGSAECLFMDPQPWYCASVEATFDRLPATR